MLKFIKKEKLLLVCYDPEGGVGWITSKLSYEPVVALKKIFYISSNDVYKPIGEEQDDFDETEEIIFILGTTESEYYHIKKEILAIDFDLFLFKDMKFDSKVFIAGQGSSIFKNMGRLKPLEAVYIGGPKEDAIPLETFAEMIKLLPNSYEIAKYSDARISYILRQYFDTEIDGLSSYEKYMESKNTSLHEETFPASYNDFEEKKFREMLKILESMLCNEIDYSENEWQDKILKIIKCIYPKYIGAIKEAPLKDNTKDKLRSIDVLLLDADGAVDIIEIKKPFDQCIITSGKYRDNHIPLRDLSGTIMQVEKYIFHLNKWGKEGESYYNKKYGKDYPDGFKIKITNPKGIVIMGRSKNLSEEQKADFEIIKRKYSNILDIVTYDDLMNRLNTIANSIVIRT